jgi:hypothetical protein
MIAPLEELTSKKEHQGRAVRKIVDQARAYDGCSVNLGLAAEPAEILLVIQ